MREDGNSNANLSLLQAVGALLVPAVKVEDDRPFLSGRPVRGDLHPVSILCPTNLHRAIQKIGMLLARETWRSPQEKRNRAE